MNELVYSALPFSEIAVMDRSKLHDDGRRWSHLTAKDLDTLHALAKRIGLKREWFQDKPGQPHYDIYSPNLRAKAVSLGAIVVSSSYLVNYMKSKYGESKTGNHVKK